MVARALLVTARRTTWLGRAVGALLLLGATAVAPPTHAAAEVRTVRGSAIAGNRDEAVVQALADAVRQVHGGEIEASRETETTLRRVTRDGGRSLSSDRRVASTTFASSAGLVSGYRIVSIERDARGGVTATLDVDVPVYRVEHVQADRQRIAVYPVETSASRYRIADAVLDADRTSERLTQSIVSMLVQSRRFSVLDRDMRRAIEREHGFLGRADVPLSEKLAIGHTLGAELLLVTRLREFDPTTVSERDPWTGEARTSNTGGAVLEARVVMPSTGQLVWARTVTAEASGFPRPLRVQDAFDSVGRTLVAELLEGIYPIRVIDGFGDAAVISQGGDTLRAGDRFEVFEIGRRYTDPYHGESLGARERRVAAVEIVSVGPRTSRVRVLDGRVDGDGQVLRRLPELAAGLPRTAPADTPRAVPTRRPRVCLPGDRC